MTPIRWHSGWIELDTTSPLSSASSSTSGASSSVSPMRPNPSTMHVDRPPKSHTTRNTTHRSLPAPAPVQPLPATRSPHASTRSANDEPPTCNNSGAQRHAIPQPQCPTNGAATNPPTPAREPLLLLSNQGRLLTTPTRNFGCSALTMRSLQRKSKSFELQSPTR